MAPASEQSFPQAGSPGREDSPPAAANTSEARTGMVYARRATAADHYPIAADYNMETDARVALARYLESSYYSSTYALLWIVRGRDPDCSIATYYNASGYTVQ